MSKSKYKTTFLGIRQQHSYELHGVIDLVLKDFPGIEDFVEIGTGNGAMSIFLGLHAYIRGGKVFTCDVIRREGLFEAQKMFEVLPIQFCQVGCFSEEGMKMIKEIIGYKPSFVFCDGADKPEELNTFSRYITLGSIICAHDYGTEIKDKDIDIPWLKFIHRDLWESVETCFFEKT